MAKKTAVKPKAPQTTGDTVEDSSLTTVIKAFNQAWEYTNSSWHGRWEDNYRLYNNQRIKYGYQGISDTFVPMVFSTVETLTSALFGTKPKFDYLPPSSAKDQNTDILNGLLNYYWDKDQWSMKVINTGRGMLREGTGVDYFAWDRDHPRLINVPIRDFFIDPNAYELDESTTGYCGRRFLTTLDKLKEFEVIDMEKMDENGDPTGEMKPKYQNLDKLKSESSDEPVKGTGTTPGDQRTDKQEKDLFYGSTLNEPQKDQIEVIEYWTVDKTVSIANRSVVIEDTENYFKAKDRANGSEFPQGLLPFAPARDYVDGSLFYAKGEVDFISDQQEDLNDFSNQSKDAVSYNLNQMYTLDPKYAHMIDEVENLPGAVYPFEAGTLNPITHGVIPPEAFNERMNIKAEIRETTASNEVIRGAAATTTPGTDPTATEINAQIAGAGQRISLKVTQIENEYFHRMAKIVFRMIQLYVTEPMMVQILGKTGVSWQTFDPAEFKGQYEPRVQLDITVQSAKQKQSNDAANMLKAFLGDPNVNQKELAKIVLQRGFDLEPDEVEALLTPEEPPADPPVPPEPPQSGGADPMAALLGSQPQPQVQPTDIVPHPVTGEPVMAGQLM